MSKARSLIIISSLTGCVVHEDPTTTDLPRISPNGASLTGVVLDGIRPASPSAVTLRGVAPVGTTPSGTPLSISTTGPTLSGTAAVGSQWSAQLSDGTSLTLRIDAAQQGSNTNSDTWGYRLSALAGTTWKSLCVDAAGNPGFAIAVRGTWNLAQGVAGGGSYLATTSDFTFACRGSAAAKCVELGYSPWTGQAAALASCVRALRGDYCGDGIPYTADGTQVNMFDASGTLPDDMTWEPEAAWTADGATCVSKKKETRFSQELKTKPACFPHSLKAKKSCGTAFSDGISIITELAPN